MPEQTELLGPQAVYSRVLGDAYSFIHGPEDCMTVARYEQERKEAIESGEPTWKVRKFSTTGAVADLYINTGLVAIMMYDVETGGTVYGDARIVGLGDTTLCEGETFGRSVARAEEFAFNANIRKEDDLENPPAGKIDPDN